MLYKRGSLFLGLLMLIVVMSIIALRILPETHTLHERDVEQEFTITIGNIRAAMDIERNMGASSPCIAEYNALLGDPSDPAKIDAYLDCLAEHNLLNHANPKDPTIPAYRWGIGANELFWQAQQNLVSSHTAYGVGSFEAGTEEIDSFNSPVGWVNSFPEHDNATFSSDTPSNEDSSYDDYLGQNRFGRANSFYGNCLRLASSTY